MTVLSIRSRLCRALSATALWAMVPGISAQLSLAPAGAPAQSAAAKQPQERLRSRIFIYDLRDGTSHMVYTADAVWEAPNFPEFTARQLGLGARSEDKTRGPLPGVAFCPAVSLAFSNQSWRQASTQGVLDNLIVFARTEEHPESWVAHELCGRPDRTLGFAATIR